jgi:virulence-associated protein VagC
MMEMVLDIQTLPEEIFSRIPTKKVKVYEENGTITLTPFSEEKLRFDHLIGIFSDGRISIDDFLEEKQREKELES